MTAVIFNFGAIFRLVVNLKCLRLYPEQGSRHKLNRRLGGHHSRSGRFEEAPVTNSGIRFADGPACSLVTASTDLTLLAK
jgi:hypothetical protein